MADARFYARSGPFTLARLAEITGATLKLAKSGAYSKADANIADVASLELANAECITFLDNSKYSKQLADSKAGAC